ncbi:uncharacterized protein EI97DRAFT_386865 [Westerdykella ornata]|uniref:Uncharacterized protein n=1 Tax=Westerdykella ornata TaxID=318751 RepID=A0A6A6J693_WESOR|nr:uncharacterized protein EI97DRAFT_386865 [Westerdykella ornata]KAF2271912.1 hypothetical protein EI97DRAFT_386865 [Westerdykella ornata]
MSPLRPTSSALLRREDEIQKPTDPDGLILEAWAQGFMVGSLIIMAFITMANMRRGVLLHKLILGIWQGFWLFFHRPVYAWWLSVGAIPLNASWSLHNVVSWMKIKPFLSRPVSWAFIGSIILVQPYWVVEIYANFAYFHKKNELFIRTRPWEALCRDPWWIFTTVALVWIIKTQYDLTLKEIIRISPRFGIMLLAMVISVIFIILDICSVTSAFQSTLPVGINPFWKLAFVFKCLTDMVVLDDFKTALDRLRAFKISRIGSFCQDTSDRRTWDNRHLVEAWEREASDPYRDPLSNSFPSPDPAVVDETNFLGSGDHSSGKQRTPSEQAGNQASSSSQGHSSRDLGEINGDPENIVSSALYGPPLKPVDPVFLSRPNGDHNHGWPATQDSASVRDYARAIREVELGPWRTR